MKKKVSLKDIAQKLGVSTALVSYVLNNQKVDRISKEVAQKVKDTAAELNYRTNHIARSLKTNKSFTIGLIVADISNAFSSSLARIIENEAEQNNYTVLFGSSDESADRSLKLIHLLLNHGVDGLIIAPSEDSTSLILYLQENEIPFVLLDRYIPELKASYVSIDNYKAAYAATQHFIDNGNSLIGMITFNSSLFNLLERKRGYTSALKDHNIAGKKSWIKEVSMTNSKKQVEEAINDLLSLPDPVEAILFASNTLSTFGLKYINTLDIKVPNDLSIISFDESDASELFYAPLTHIKQPLQEMGQLAFKLLFESIEKNNKVTQVNLEAELVIRKSTLSHQTIIPGT
jgi:LacI family transcriptional regulator